jgi:hypothetical protein
MPPSRIWSWPCEASWRRSTTWAFMGQR